jgi:hypothetical protein
MVTKLYRPQAERAPPGRGLRSAAELAIVNRNSYFVLQTYFAPASASRPWISVHRWRHIVLGNRRHPGKGGVHGPVAARPASAAFD